jgi:hypothetical protein
MLPIASRSEKKTNSHGKYEEKIQFGLRPARRAIGDHNPGADKGCSRGAKVARAGGDDSPAGPEMAVKGVPSKTAPGRTAQVLHPDALFLWEDCLAPTPRQQGSW